MNLENLDIFLIIITIAIVVKYIWSFIITYRQNKMYKKLGQFFDTQKKGDIYSVLKEYLEETREVEAYAKSIEKKMTKISKKMEASIQKVGFVRYNPFGKDDTGGNQSFSVALLDENNNGIVVTSMHAREGTRVYAKNIVKGKSTHSLSEEEKKSISKAIK